MDGAARETDSPQTLLQLLLPPVIAANILTRYVTNIVISNQLTVVPGLRSSETNSGPKASSPHNPQVVKDVDK